MVNSEPKAPTALVWGAIVAIFVVLAATYSWVGDDCFITFRYARNVASGLGPRYNVAADPPVEGYSEFAWMLWMAVSEGFSLDPRTWSRVSSVAAGVALLVWVIWFARRRLELGVWPAAAAGLFFVTAPTVVLWATGGMGTMPFALAVFVTWERLLGDPDRPRGGQAAVAGVLALLLRADGFYWVGLVFAVAMVRALSARRRALLWQTLGCAAVVAVVMAAHTWWRLSYYEDWMPNTARAKVSMSAASLKRGWFYLVHYWLTVPATLLVFGVGLLGSWRRGEPWVRACVAISAGTFLYGVLSSGDFMPMGRFFLPALPFLALIVGWLVRRELQSGHRVRCGVICAALFVGSVPALFDLHLTPRSWLEAFRVRQHGEYRTEQEFWAYEAGNARRWSDLGRALAKFAEPGSSLVRGPIGAVGYYSNLTIYDIAGLVSREVVEQVAPKPVATPGHDRAADPAFFAKYDPTYSHAQLVYVSEGRQAIGRARELAKAGEVEVFRIAKADGYLDDGLLVLRRFKQH